MKEKIAEVMFSNKQIGQKRVEIRKMKSEGLSKEYINMFLKLLDYISEV